MILSCLLLLIINKIIKEVSVTLNGCKKGPKDHQSSAQNQNHLQNSQKKGDKKYKIESRLYQPTMASKGKREAVLSEQRMKFEKHQKEVKKMVASSRFMAGHIDVSQGLNPTTEREESPRIDIASQVKTGQGDRGGTPKITLADSFNNRNNSRRKRKDRYDKIQYEKSPSNPSNRFLVKHTYTKLEHDAAGPKFTVIK